MKPKRIKVLHLIGALNRGGAETVVVNLCNNIDATRFDMRICTLADSIPMADRLVRHTKQTVTTCGWRYGRPLFRNYALPGWRLRRVIRDFRPDVIHSHFYVYLSLYQYLASLGLGGAHVVTLHNTGKHYERSGHWPSQAYRTCETLNIRLCDARAVAVSEAVAAVARKWLHVPSGRLRVIYNGIDTNLFSRSSCAAVAREQLGCDRAGLLVVCVARFHEQKGHRYLIKAWPSVLSAVPNARLVLVGEGPLRQEMQTQAEKLGVAGSIRFLGVRDDVRNVLAACDVGVFPSLFEGLGIAAVEMMSMELPVVATDIPALREVIAPPSAGVLVPVASPALLAEALIRLLKNADLRNIMGRAGRQRASSVLSIAKQAQEHERLYLSLLHGPSAVDEQDASGTGENLDER